MLSQDDHVWMKPASMHALWQARITRASENLEWKWYSWSCYTPVKPIWFSYNKYARELRQAQLDDPDIKPVLEWFGESSNKPSWEEVAPHSSKTKIYLA